jgi:hypothetical protein
VFRELADTLRARGGVVLAFTVPDASVATGEQLRRVSGMRVIAQLEDGIVLEAEPTNNKLPGARRALRAATSLSGAPGR